MVSLTFLTKLLFTDILNTQVRENLFPINDFYEEERTMLKNVVEIFTIALVGVLLVWLSAIIGNMVELISGILGYILVAASILLLFTRRSPKEEWKKLKSWIGYKIFPNTVIENPCEIPCCKCTEADRENCRTPKDVSNERSYEDG